MSCAFSPEALALHVEGDLPAAAARTASSHITSCADCRQVVEQLRATQSLLKSLRHETISASECATMRREVMSIITEQHEQGKQGGPGGWAVRIERTIMLGFRRRSYALAACALLAITSVSVLAQRRRPGPDPAQSPAVFDGNALIRPEGYRDWLAVGPATWMDHSRIDHGAASAAAAAMKRVYINPSGYQGYVNSGTFPDGTLLVWESIERESEAAGRPRERSSVLLAAAKDSARFGGAGGWGFFDFSGPGGKALSRAPALPESTGCRACHRQDAETDHVFTQFYPVLRSAHHRVQLAGPRSTTDLTALLVWSRPSKWPGPSVAART
jgi:hypothetical protein